MATEEQGLSPLDPSSFSRPELAVVSNIFIKLNVNFDRKVLNGQVDLTVKKVDKDIDEIILDAKDLNITKIVCNATNESLQYTLSEPFGEFGSKLTVALPSNSSNNDSAVLTIYYTTSPNASGLQWLSPNQTAGKQHPYLFSQFQAIHARSVIPCQDTPAVKTKYQATISVPKDLTVLMSAIPRNTKTIGDQNLAHFVQDVPMPSYLIAIAVGALESRKLGPRSHVWAEREIIEACEYEFADTEYQLKTAEDICGPYVWGIYDLLVLPLSFPFGGMENPCLTFVTPTLLAGDRSLASVVAHEISHSWTGNLVTNRNFEHFWLNEGFTMFVERKIKRRLFSPKEQDFEAYGGLVVLKETVNELGNDSPITKLVVDLKGVHPDDAFSTVPYEKGYTFLRYLENLVGGPDHFEPFLRKYFDTFKYKSIDTDDFKNFFTSEFQNNSNISTIDWNTWLYAAGMPPVIPDYDKSLTLACVKVKNEIVTWNPTSGEQLDIDSKEIEQFSVNQLICLLHELLDSGTQPIARLQAIDTLFGFSGVRNAEIKFLWLRLCLKAHWEPSIEIVLKWVNEVGRMKYVRPLYRDLYAWELARPKAIENFQANMKFMMHVVSYTVAKDLQLI